MMLSLFPWKWIGIGAVAFVVLGLFVALKMTQAQNDKLKVQIERCEEFRRQLAEDSERLRIETERRLKDARARIVYVERTVKGLENRPLPEECATPDVSEWQKVL